MDSKLSTGIPSLDIRLDGGLPRGRIVELFGPHSTGKSSLAIGLMAEAEHKNHISVLFDVDNMFDIEYARAGGLEYGPTFYSEPRSAEEILSICENVIDSNDVDLIVLDDIGSLASKGEQEHGRHVNRILDEKMRSIVSKLSHSKTCMVMLNQIRTPFPKLKADHYTTPGGKMIKKYAQQRIQFHHAKFLRDQDDIDNIGIRLRYRVLKRLGQTPYTSSVIDYYYDGGVDVEADLIRLGLDTRILQLSGNWIKLGDKTLGNGIRKAAEKLRSSKEVKCELEEQLQQYL